MEYRERIQEQIRVIMQRGRDNRRGGVGERGEMKEGVVSRRCWGGDKPIRKRSGK